MDDVPHPRARLRDAIGELRTIPGTDEQREELHRELRQLQEKSLAEMGVISTPIDLKEIVESTERAFEGLPMAEAIWQFAQMARPTRSARELRRKALKRRSGLADLFHGTSGAH